MKFESISRYFSFRTRLMIAMVLIGVVSAGIMAVYGFFHERHHTYEVVEKQYVTINQAEVMRFQTLMNQLRENLLLVAMMPQVQELIRTRDTVAMIRKAALPTASAFNNWSYFFGPCTKTAVGMFGYAFLTRPA